MQLILGVAFVALVLIGSTATWFIGKRARAAKLAAYVDEIAALCAPLGLSPLPRGELWVPTFACAGDYRGARALVVLAPDRTRTEPYKPRVELLVDTGLLAGIKGNVQDLSGKATPTGPEGQALAAYVNPVVQSAASGLQDPRLVGMALLGKGAALDLAIRARWPEGWSTVGVYGWLPRDASSEQVRAALDSMLRVREALAQEVGA